jgi:4-nitrophenyl phosphatase
MIDFKALNAVLSDMDGVLWRGDMPLAGAAEFFAFLRPRLPYAFLTNNSTRTPAYYVEKLAQQGIHATPDAIFTSSVVMSQTLAYQYPQKGGVYVVGEKGLQTLLREQGFHLTEAGEATPLAVVVGLDRAFNYDKLHTAQNYIRAGAVFWATNEDKTFPLAQGLAPGAGSLVAAVAAASGQSPQVVGKPHPPMFESALAHLKFAPQSVLMIGDRLDTDIVGAKALGLKTALVLSGVTASPDFSAEAHRPDVVCATLSDLLAMWEA